MAQAEPWLVAAAVSAVLAFQHRSILSFEQSLLLPCWPACCAYQLSRARKRKRVRGWESWAQGSARFLQISALLGVCSCMLRFVWHDSPMDAAVVLPCAALLSLAQMTIPTPEMPLGDFVPWWSLTIIFCIGTFGGPELKAAAGLSMGRCDGGPLVWSALCAIVSTVALVAWSRCWVRGEHGTIQDALAPLVSPLSIFPLAIVNALREELQFRFLFLSAIIAGGASSSTPLMAFAMVQHSIYFALLHFLGGFPTGHSGFGLVFIWSVFLDLLRVWSGGMGLVFLLHVQADVAIFALVLVREWQRERDE